MWSSYIFPVLTVYISYVTAWGGVFNRFSPELLSNLGYGGFGGFGGVHQPGEAQKSPSPVDLFEQILEDEDSEEPCYGKRCTANEHCCPGSVCVDVDGLVGSCLPAFGREQGQTCTRDNDCETGLVCTETEQGARTCQTPLAGKKQYGESCHMSSDCDIAKGLCCQVQRRHRQAPRKVCSYFKDPLICIGPVAVEQIRDQVEHTAGEKRITSKASAFKHLRN